MPVISFLKQWKILIFLLVSAFILLTAFITNYSSIKTETRQNQDEINIYINFLLPMSKASPATKVEIIPEIPSTPVIYSLDWVNNTTLKLTLAQKGHPQGQQILFRIDSAPTIIPVLKKSAAGKVRPDIPLKMLSGTTQKEVPSHGPIYLNFNSPVEPKSIKQNVVLPAPGQLKPVRVKLGDISYLDLSKWQYIPDQPLNKNETYHLKISPDLVNLSGNKLGRQYDIVFNTAPGPTVVNTSPVNSAAGVQLYRKIEFVLDRGVDTASIKVTDSAEKKAVPGITKIDGEKIVFQPSYAFLPGKEYEARLEAASKNYGEIKYKITFSTVDMEDKFWVEVKLGKKHSMTVYKGDKKIRNMPVSGGKAESPTPMGYFYTQDRGYSFWSSRFGEGATYWVRLVGQILIHSVPRDSQWRIKESEHSKLGLPASHGCVRLDEKDAMWFYENIPRGTMVIIHE